jgi:microcin C transport system permease protein
MTAYFIRRFLLIIPTFLGITVIVFVITNFVPGGPVERQIMRMRGLAGEAGGVGGGRGAIAIPEEEVQEIRRYYGFDKPVYIRSGTCST